MARRKPSLLLSSICLESGTDIQLALYYLKAYLLRHGPSLFREVRVRVFNETIPSREIVSRILRYDPAVTGFSCYVWNIEKTLGICRALKRARPAMKIVLGGPEAGPRAKELLGREPSVDAVVKGEGEETFLRLCRAIAEGRPHSGIEAGPLLEDLDDVPSPYLGGLIDLKDRDIMDVPLETSRGCAFRCHYCYYHKNFLRVRYFPFSRVEKEIRLILRHKPYELYLMDATFNADPARAKRILRTVIRYNRGSKLHVELKAELVDEETAVLLHKANANNIEIGIQSTKPATLKAINRGLNKKKFRRGIGLLNRYGLFYEIQLIDALPLQTYEDLLSSLDWLYAMRPPKVNILRLFLLPGTVLREQARRYGIVFSPQAPYRAHKSSAMSRMDLAKVERLRFAIQRLYDNCVFRDTLFALCGEGGMRFSEVFEEWMRWERGFKRRGPSYVELLNRRLPDFLKYVCRRRNAMGLYRKLLPDLLKVLPQ